MWLMLAALAAGVWLLVRRWSESGFDTRDFFSSLAHANPGWLAASALFAILSYYGRALRWMVMLRPIAPSASHQETFSATCIGYAAVTLFGRPGEFVRPYLIARAAQVPFPSQVAAWALERIYDTLFILAIFGYALAGALGSGRRVGPTLHWALEKGGWITGISCTLCLGLLAVLHHHSEAVERRLRAALGFLKAHHQGRAAAIITAVMDGLRSTRSGRSVFLMFALSILEWLIIFAATACLFRAFPETAVLPPTAVLVFVGFVSFGGIVQLPGIGGGVQLVSVVVLTELFGLDIEPATGVALANWITTFLVVVPLGAFLAFRQGLKWSKIIELEREATL